MRLFPVSRRRGPAFMFVEGHLWSDMNGVWTELKEGQPLHYWKHGDFELEYAGVNYGIVRHLSLRGRKRVVFIPPQKGAFISDGDFQFYDHNYTEAPKASSEVAV